MTKLRYFTCICFWVLTIIFGWVAGKERGSGWFVFVAWTLTMTILMVWILKYFKMKGHKMLKDNNKNQIAVCIMPWAGLRETIQIGPVKFWPWDENQVSDPEVKSRLNRYFKCFVDHYGHAVNTITVCSYGIKDFQLLTQQEYNTIRDAIDILVFSVICTQTKRAVCANNSSIGPPATDRYQVIGQELRPEDPNLYIKAGSLLSVEEMNKAHISQPWCVGGFLGTDPNDELVSAFSKLFDGDFPANVREQIFRSIEWFRLAHTEAEHVSDLSKLVMMATAFEILLEFPERGQTAYFAEQVDKHLRLKESILKKRPDKNGKEYEACLAAWWAWDFYDLRSRIVHGDTITVEDLRYKNWLTHLIVADLVLRELVMRILYQYGCFGEKLRRNVAIWAPHSSDSAEALEASLLPGILGLDFESVHQVLGWIS